MSDGDLRDLEPYSPAWKEARDRLHREDPEACRRCFPADVLAALTRLGPPGADEPRPPELPRHVRLRPDLLSSESLLAGRGA